MLSLFKISKKSFIFSICFLATCLFTSITFSNLKADTQLFNEAQYHVEEIKDVAPAF